MSDKITVTVDGEERDILMSYGLLTELTRIVSRPEYVPAIAIDPDARDAVINALLAERSKGGKIVTPTQFNDVEVSMEDIDRLLSWSQDRLMDFFLKSARKAQELVARTETELTPSSTGIEG